MVMRRIDKVLDQDTAYRVTKSLWTLYNALSSGTLTLIDVAPIVSFRCAVTLSTTAGHTDCAGTVIIGSEVLMFTQASKKTSTTFLSALPTIQTSNIDCNIKITCTDTNGNDLQKETLTAIKCAWVPSQKYFQDSQGTWRLSEVVALTKSQFLADDIISYSDYDYTVKQVVGGDTILDHVAPYKLMLIGGGPSPIGREVDDMQKAVYDKDNDGIVDEAEGIREVTEFPVVPKPGDMVLKDGKVYIAV
jgi:hypothetical protein